MLASNCYETNYLEKSFDKNNISKKLPSLNFCVFSFRKGLFSNFKGNKSNLKTEYHAYVKSNHTPWNLLAIPVVKKTSHTGGAGSIPDQGVYDPHASQPKKKKRKKHIKQKQCCNKFSKDYKNGLHEKKI